MAKKTTYEVVTEDVIRLIETEGLAPWKKTWIGYGPTSISSGKPYRGINALILPIKAQIRGYASTHWGTYKTIAAAGGQIRTGEKGTRVVYWGKVDPAKKKKPSAADLTKRSFMFCRTFTVFNAEQADWPAGTGEDFFPEAVQVDETVAVAHGRLLLQAYLDRADGPEFVTGGDRACYSPPTDTITVPHEAGFDTIEDYVSTCFHEAGHSTGHATRLNREGIEDRDVFGSEIYSREELIAEFTACFLCAEVGMVDTRPNSAAYLKSWVSFLQSDPEALVKGASAARKAADLILGLEPPVYAD